MVSLYMHGIVWYAAGLASGLQPEDSGDTALGNVLLVMGYCSFTFGVVLGFSFG